MIEDAYSQIIYNIIKYYIIFTILKTSPRNRTFKNYLTLNKYNLNDDVQQIKLVDIDILELNTSTPSALVHSNAWLYSFLLPKFEVTLSIGRGVKIALDQLKRGQWPRKGMYRRRKAQLYLEKRVGRLSLSKNIVKQFI